MKSATTLRTCLKEIRQEQRQSRVNEPAHDLRMTEQLLGLDTWCQHGRCQGSPRRASRDMQDRAAALTNGKASNEGDQVVYKVPHFFANGILDSSAVLIEALQQLPSCGVLVEVGNVRPKHTVQIAPAYSIGLARAYAQ